MSLLNGKDEQKLAKLLNTTPDKLAFREGDEEGDFDNTPEDGECFVLKVKSDESKPESPYWYSSEDEYKPIVGLPWRSTSCCGLAEVTLADALNTLKLPEKARPIFLKAFEDYMRKEGFGGLFATTIQTEKAATRALTAAKWKRVRRFKSGKTGNFITLFHKSLGQTGQVR